MASCVSQMSLLLGSLIVASALNISLTQNISLCVDDTEFTLFEQLMTFAEAKAECALHGQTLARVSNYSEYVAITNLTDEQYVWIGMCQ